MRRTSFGVVGLLVFVGGVAAAVAQGTDQPLAKPPKWPQDVLDIFFNDARQALVGQRPNYASQGGTPAAGGGGAPTVAGRTAAEAQKFAWSGLIGPDTIETEIKRQAPALQPLVATPTGFKGGGYQECRDRFTLLATLFAVAANYDETVRWQDSAGGLAEMFGRAGSNCKVGTDQSFREAQLRAQDLAELVRGGRPAAPSPKPLEDWSEVTDRTPLMRRMEESLNGKISPNASDARTMARHAEDLQHEAELLAMMAEVLMRPGMSYAGDESYDSHAVGLRDAAVAFAKGVELENFDAAREALGNMSKSCTACHDEFR